MSHKGLRHTFKRWALYLFALIVVLLATGTALARLTLQLLPEYQKNIETKVLALTGYPVTLGQLQVGWRGFNPVVTLSDVRVYEPEQAGHLITRFSELRLRLGVLSSLRAREPRVDLLYLSGLHVQAERDASGQFHLTGIRSQGGRDLDLDEWVRLSRYLPPQVVFSDVSLDFADHKLNRQMRWHDLRLQWQKETDSAHLMIQSDALGDSVRSSNLVVRMEGDVAQWRQAKYEIYGRVEGLHLGRLAQAVEWHPVPELELFTVNASIWAYGVGGGLQWAQVQVEDDHNVYETVVSELMATPTDFVSANVSWQKDASGWQITADQVGINIGSMVLPSLAFQYRQSDEERSLILNHWNLEGVAAFLGHVRPVPDNIQNIVRQLNPHGNIRSAEVSWIPGEQKPIGGATITHLAAQFSDIETQQYARIPGVSGVSGTIGFDGHLGQLELAAQRFRLDYVPLFPDPVTVESLGGRVYFGVSSATDWWFSAKNLHLKDKQLEGLAHLDVINDGHDKGPYVNLRAQVTNASAQKVMSSFPYGFMPDKAAEYLKQSIVGGSASLGRFVLLGRVKSFPFDGGEGVFHIEANVQDGQFDPAPGWPSIHHARADLIFNGLSFEGRSSHAKLYDSEALNGRVWIENLINTEVEIKGKLKGDAADAARFFREVPLFNTHPVYSQVNASGPVEGSLELHIPVKHLADTRLKGRLLVKNSRLWWPSWHLSFEKVDGQIDFTESSVTSEEMTGQFKGQPFRSRVKTDYFSGVPWMNIQGAGWISVKDAIEDYVPEYQRYAEGRSEWFIELSAPMRRSVESGRLPWLAFKSTLVGTEVKLPDYLGKPEGASTAFEGKWLIGEKRQLLTLDYGDYANVALSFASDGRRLSMRGANVYFGDQKAPTKGIDGINIGGVINHLDLPVWQQWWSSQGGDDERADEVGLSLRSVKLLIGKFQGFGQEYSDLGVAWSDRGDYGKLKLTGPQVVGDVTHSDHLWYGRFSKLNVVKPESSEKYPSTLAMKRMPQDYPELDFKVSQFSLSGELLGALDIVGAPTASGYALKKLKLEGKVLDLDAEGGWSQSGNNHRSQLSLKAKSGNVGRLLDRMQYPKQVKDGEGKMQANVAWKTPFYAMDYNSLNGSVEFELDRGQLLSVDPGAGGRLFGLLSVSALPRRLTLDFKDVTDTGLGFEKIYGKYRIKNGIASSNDFFLNGPAVFVKAEGVVNLVNQTYDQEVVVVPKLLNGIPLLGGLAGGPAVGVLLLFAQQLLERNVDDMDGIRYKVTGPWDEPKVERLTPIENQQPNQQDDKDSWGG